LGFIIVFNFLNILKELSKQKNASGHLHGGALRTIFSSPATIPFWLQTRGFASPPFGSFAL